MYIMGINSAYHESAACIIKDGKIISAIEEERLNRIKHAKKSEIDNADELPINAINYCLKEAKLSFKDIDYFAFSINPIKRLKNFLYNDYVEENNWGSKEGEERFYKKLKNIVNKLSEIYNTDLKNKFFYIDHHLCHAGSIYFLSSFKESAILVIDGIGETESTSLFYAKGNKIKKIKGIHYPNSLGFLWEKFSEYLGFDKYDAGKVMGLASYGDPNKYYKSFRSFIDIRESNFYINNEVTRFRENNFKEIEKIFGKKREAHEKIKKRHKDIAAALQKITNEITLKLAKYLKKKTNSNNLCLAGGVALNCIANTNILKNSGFKKINISFAPHDAGTAIGAAYIVWNIILNNKKNFVLKHPYIGPKYTDNEILQEIKKQNLRFRKVKNIEKETAKLLAKGKIIAWFQGRMEYGPRALGNRSILADPRNKNIKDYINKFIKLRESFRPLSPSVLYKHAKDWFKINKNSPASDFMLYAFEVKKDKKNLIPAVVHVDNTSRLQTVKKSINKKYHKLIEEFYKITKVPILLNTSFNIREPIVCSPKDAINTFKNSNIDYLVMNNFLIYKDKNDKHIPSLEKLFEIRTTKDGKRLALVFGNEFKYGKCPFYLAKQCIFCEIGSGEGIEFNTELNKKRLDFFKEFYKEDIDNIKHFIIYNSGSVLNQKEFSRETLKIILDFLKSKKEAKIISFDTREQFITKENIDFIIKNIRKDQEIRLILGIESWSDDIRIKKLRKIMSKENIEKAFKIVSEYKGKASLEINLLFQPPEIIGKKAIDEIVLSTKNIINLAEKYNVNVYFNFHPYYPSKKSKEMYPKHPRAKIKDAKKAIKLMSEIIKKSKIKSGIFIGWYDEGHDIDPEEKKIELKKSIDNFCKFNISQNPEDL